MSVPEPAFGDTPHPSVVRYEARNELRLGFDDNAGKRAESTCELVNVAAQAVPGENVGTRTQRIECLDCGLRQSAPVGPSALKHYASGRKSTP
jgi:hypothetical protein